MRIRSLVRSGLVAAFLAVWVACDQGREELAGSIERDSSGIAIVENAPPYPEWRLASAPDVRIGVVEGSSAYQLHNVRYAARMSDGRVVVVDGGTQEVRWYDAAGSHRSTAGGRGEGPGEFRNIGSAVLATGDTLIVHDARGQRLAWLGPDERMAREWRMDESRREQWPSG